MKYVFPALTLLAACSTAPPSAYDLQSLDSRLTLNIEQPQRELPSGFVSLFEQQPDGSWVLKNDPALAR